MLSARWGDGRGEGSPGAYASGVANPGRPRIPQRAAVTLLSLLGLGAAASGALLWVVRANPSWQDEHRWAALAAAFVAYGVAAWSAVAVVLVVLLRRGWQVVAVMPLAWAVATAASLPCVEPPTIAPGRPALTVLSANLYYGWGDGDDVWRAVTASDADVVILQEVTVQTRFVESGAWRERFPHRVGRVGADWSADETMVFSRLPLTESGSRPDIGVPQVLRVDTQAGPVTLAAVHAANPWSSHAAWVSEHAGLRAWASGLSGRVILAGDFNATLDHAALQRLLASGWADAGVQAGAGWQPTYRPAYATDPGSTLPALLGVDHVLATGSLVATSVQTFDVGRSDHRALVAKLAFG